MLSQPVPLASSNNLLYLLDLVFFLYNTNNTEAVSHTSEWHFQATNLVADQCAGWHTCRRFATIRQRDEHAQAHLRDRLRQCELFDLNWTFAQLIGLGDFYTKASTFFRYFVSARM